MSWKSLKQQSLAHGMLIDHKALHEFDADSLIDWSTIQDLLSDIHNAPKGEKARSLNQDSPFRVSEIAERTGLTPSEPRRQNEGCLRL